MQFAGAVEVCGFAGCGKEKRAAVLPGGYQGSSEGGCACGEECGDAKRFCQASCGGGLCVVAVSWGADAGSEVFRATGGVTGVNAAGSQVGDGPVDSRGGGGFGAVSGGRSGQSSCATDGCGNAA